MIPAKEEQMRSYFGRFTAMSLCLTMMSLPALAAKDGYEVQFSGGTMPGVKSNDTVRLNVTSDKITLVSGKHRLEIPASAVTSVEYSTEIHHRVGTGIALATVSLGVGILVACSKSKRHYIGITYDDAGTRGGLTVEAGKNEFRGVLTALEGVTGQRALDRDSEVTQSLVAATASKSTSWDVFIDGKFTDTVQYPINLDEAAVRRDVSKKRGSHLTEVHRSAVAPIAGN